MAGRVAGGRNNAHAVHDARLIVRQLEQAELLQRVYTLFHPRRLCHHFGPGPVVPFGVRDGVAGVRKRGSRFGAGVLLERPADVVGMQMGQDDGVYAFRSGARGAQLLHQLAFDAAHVVVRPGTSARIDENGGIRRLEKEHAEIGLEPAVRECVLMRVPVTGPNV